MTHDELVARLTEQRADYARIDAHVKAAALLDDVLGLLERVDGIAAVPRRDLTSREVATELGLRNHRTVERWIREGRLPGAYKTGRSELGEDKRGRVRSGTSGDWRIPPATIEAFRRCSAAVTRDAVVSFAAAGAFPAARRAWPPAGRGSRG